MSKIAILDSWVDPKRISPRAYEYIDLCRENNTPPAAKITHGTMCAMVLDHCATGYELVNIQIMPNYDGESIKTFGSVDALAEALDLCAALDVDIISMSAVTSLLSDSKKLYDKIKALSERAVIVAALDNAWYVTVPASYPFAVGVLNDSLKQLDSGQIAYHPDPVFGTDAVANCDFDFLRELGHSPSNSFAVPVVTAYINKLLNSERLNASEVFARLKALPNYAGGAALYQSAVEIKKLINRAKPKPPAPYIYVQAPDNRFCMELMDWLYDNEEAQCCALVANAGCYDVRCRVYDPALSMSQQLWRMEWFYKTDAVFVCDATGYLESLWDGGYAVKLCCEGDKVTIESGKGQCTVPRCKAAEVLSALLDEDEG